MTVDLISIKLGAVLGDWIKLSKPLSYLNHMSFFLLIYLCLYASLHLVFIKVGTVFSFGRMLKPFIIKASHFKCSYSVNDEKIQTML